MNHDWLHEFIGLAACICILKRCLRRRRTVGRYAVHDELEGLLSTVPALVAIHGQVASHDTCDAAKLECRAAPFDEFK